MHPEFLGDSLRDSVLNGEDVGHFPVIAFRPEMASIGGVD
jgi:hypothetical protein